MSDVRIGQTVRHNDRAYIVLDRHPDAASWWLQDAETGAVSHGQYAHERHLEIVADPFRALPDTVTLTNGTTARAVAFAGDWAVIRTGRTGHDIVHVPSGRTVSLSTQGTPDTLGRVQYRTVSATTAREVLARMASLTVGDPKNLTADERAAIRAACRGEEVAA